jgi:hypothetical protein
MKRQESVPPLSGFKTGANLDWIDRNMLAEAVEVR